jgi:hypothetical protein
MKNLLKIKSIITIMLVVALIALAFLTRSESIIVALTTAVSVAVGSLYSKKDSTEDPAK